MNREVETKKKRDFIILTDWSSNELLNILDLADDMKKRPEGYREALKGQTLGMIFNKNSTRTRVSFEVGIYQLGGLGLFFSPQQLQIARGEPIQDTAKVLSRYLNAIMIRTFGYDEVESLALHSSIPVINGLTDFNHPCQVMADLMTIREKLGPLERKHWGIKMAYIGDGNNMAHSLMFGAVKMGFQEIAIASPENYQISPKALDLIREEAQVQNTKITITKDPLTAAKGSHVICTDTWASMGQEQEHEIRKKAFSQYTIDQSLMSLAHAKAIFMHCLPAHRGEEVLDEVIDGPQSVIYDEAENRLHVQKAIMYTLMRNLNSE